VKYALGVKLVPKLLLMLRKQRTPWCGMLICEIIYGEVSSLRTFDALTIGGLKASNQLETGIDDKREIIRQTERLVAPVAWALFMEKLPGMNGCLQV
jgi:hypothetical protein